MILMMVMKTLSLNINYFTKYNLYNNKKKKDIKLMIIVKIKRSFAEVPKVMFIAHPLSAEIKTLSY